MDRGAPLVAAGVALWPLLLIALLHCSLLDDYIELPPLELDSDVPPLYETNFSCASLTDTACESEVFRSCRKVAEFLEVVSEDCGAKGLECRLDLGCTPCVPGRTRCQPCSSDDEDCDTQRVERCANDGSGYEVERTCDFAAGDGCQDGSCQNMCESAARARSYVGCDFFAVDLDNVALDPLNNASAQQYAVAVANPYQAPITVSIEVNDAPLGDPVQVRVVEERRVAPDYLEVFELPAREVDGSSPGGLNDGTHTALSSNAYRVRSSHPITAYQFNPLDNVNVFSNDASLLLPSSAVGEQYTVVGWPQTIGSSDNPALDFDGTSDDEDLRAFLTVVGIQEATQVTVTFGEKVNRVLGSAEIPEAGPGDEIEVTLGPFDVLNLETEGTNADFTGSVVSADKPVVAFIGSEASDVPGFDDLGRRQCCADHLEEQLLPDRTLGSDFVVAHMPSRARALNAAAIGDTDLGVAEMVESERVRLVAVMPGTTTVTTSLPSPLSSFTLEQHQDALLEVEEDFTLRASGPVAVLQALPSQGVTGIPRTYPGGDPAIVIVPPREQYRSDYIFLTPDKYAFDFVTLMGAAGVKILLDGISVDDRSECEPHILGPTAQWPTVVYRCQLSFPEIEPGMDPKVLPGTQNDGVHRVVASEPVGLVVYGFDSFVSYAYAGGLDLEFLF